MKSQQQFLGAIKRQGIKKKLKKILQTQNSGLQQLQIRAPRRIWDLQ